MSLLLRSFLRDPRPLTRAIRRFDDDWFMDEWPARKIRRTAMPTHDHPISLMGDMSRQMANTLSRMQEFVDEMESLDELSSRLENRKRRDEAVVKRTESGGLQLALDVADYKPEDLKIKLIDDHLLVEADRESAGEDSYRKSHFKRWFRLPDDCKIDEIKSKLTDDNRLLIDLPLNKPIESNARTIPIEMAKKQAVTGDDNQMSEHGQQQLNESQHEEHGEHARRSTRRQ